MNMTRPLVKALALAFCIGGGALDAQQPAVPAAPAPSGTRIAVIKESNVNVRGKATIHSEVVTQLQQGDRLEVLETITLKDPKQGDPTEWVKVSLPATSHVWVHGAYIDPNSQTIKADLLNLRGGPGENYSVIGRAPQGTAVKEIERKGEWVKIEAPKEAYAFVAAYLVNIESGEPPLQIAAANTTPPETPAAKETPVDPAQPPPIVPESVADPANPATPVTGEEPAPIETTEPVLAQEETPVQPVEPPPPPPKRIVHREGIVRRSLSIQAPTSFVLEDLDSRRTINYLHAPSTNIVLLDFYGMRVLVTGEEMLDERWRKTPVINIDSIEPVP